MVPSTHVSVCNTQWTQDLWFPGTLAFTLHAHSFIIRLLALTRRVTFLSAPNLLWTQVLAVLTEPGVEIPETTKPHSQQPSPIFLSLLAQSRSVVKEWYGGQVSCLEFKYTASWDMRNGLFWGYTRESPVAKDGPERLILLA